MENEINGFDRFMTIILVIIVCCGVGFTVSNRVVKHPFELNMDNYKQYVKFGSGSYGGDQTMHCDVYFKSAMYYKLADVTVTFSLEGKCIGKHEFTQSFTASYDEAYQFSVEVPSQPPPYSYVYNNRVFEWLEIEITVIDIQGQVKYIGIK